MLRSSGWLRAVAALVGVAAFVAGATTLFALDNSAGSLFLVTLGVVLLAAAALGDRLELDSLDLFGAKIRVRDVLSSHFAVGDQSATDGRPREQAVALQRLTSLYRTYEYTRGHEKPSPDRTRLLDQIASEMESVGRATAFDPAEVSNWFHAGTDPLRVIAVNVMLARPDCRDFSAVLETIGASRSAFEQYLGLRLAFVMAPDLATFERTLLRNAIQRAQRRGRFQSDSSRARVAEGVLAVLEPTGSPRAAD